MVKVHTTHNRKSTYIELLVMVGDHDNPVMIPYTIDSLTIKESKWGKGEEKIPKEIHMNSLL